MDGDWCWILGLERIELVEFGQEKLAVMKLDGGCGDDGDGDDRRVVSVVR
jgi:hypothetical protein